MSIARKIRRVFFLPALILGAGLIVAQSAGVKAAAKGQAQNNGPAESEQVAKGRTVFGESCIQCHSMNTVMIEHKPAQQWRGTVYSMISRGAELTPDEIEPVVAYLAATFGPSSTLPLPGASSSNKSGGVAAGGVESLPAGKGKQVLMRTCVRCHSLSLVTASRKSEDGWVKTVARMVSYGAALAPANQQVLVQYLAKNLGGKK